MTYTKRPFAIGLWLLVLVLFFSGCVGSSGNKKPTGEGIEVVSFNTQTEIDSGDQFDLDLVVQNFGDSEATKINANLFQTSGIQALNSNVLSTSSLLPPNNEKGIEGEEQVFTWSLLAPILRNDETKSLQARITYDYTSTANSNFYIVPKTQLNEKGKGEFQTYSTSSAGPVTLSIVPMPAFKSSPPQKTNVQVNLIVSNTGGGKVVDSKVSNLLIILKGEGAELDVTSKCSDVSSGTISLYGRDQSRAIRCNFDFEPKDTAVSYIIEAKASYTYYFDTNPISITVKKSENPESVLTNTKSSNSRSSNLPPTVTTPQIKNCEVNKRCEITWSTNDRDGSITKYETDFCGTTREKDLAGKATTGLSSADLRIFNSPTICDFKVTVWDDAMAYTTGTTKVKVE